MSKCSYRTGELAHTHLFRRTLEASDVALSFCVPVGDFQTKCCWLGVDTVRASDNGCVFELLSATTQDITKSRQIVQNDLWRALDMEGVRRCNPVLDGE